MRIVLQLNVYIRMPVLLLSLIVGTGFLPGCNTTDKDDTLQPVATVYPTEDVVIADYIVTRKPFSADASGNRDCTAAIQSALDACSADGGGTVFMPAGKYRLNAPVYIPGNVTLRGDWQDPDTGNDYGTIILAYMPSSVSQTPGLINTNGGSSGVYGLTVYYPEQDIGNVKPYPFTFYVISTNYVAELVTIKNCTVINGYQGIGACCVSGEPPHSMLSIDTFKGTFLSAGTELYNSADVNVTRNVSISSKYWAQAGNGLAAAPQNSIAAYIRANGVGMKLGDIEWGQFANVVISGYRYGVQIVQGKRIAFSGSFLDFTVDDCDTALKADYVDQHMGILISRSTFSGSVKGIDYNGLGIIKMTDVSVTGGISGTGEIMQCAGDLSSYVIDYSRTYQKPSGKIHTVSAPLDISLDASSRVQKALDAATAGGVVYLAAGRYRFEHPVSVPAGVELRGAGSLPTRGQWPEKGTDIFCYYGVGSDFSESDTALITLAGENAGVNGIRIVYPTGTPKNPSLSTYTIRGTAKGVYCVNASIAGSAYGVDFRGCDNHVINRLVACCYLKTMSVGGKNGLVTGCLANATIIYGQEMNPLLVDWIYWQNSDDGKTTLLPFLRLNNVFLDISGADGEMVYNSFAYAPRSVAAVSGSTGVLMCNIAADFYGGDSAPIMAFTASDAVAINYQRCWGISYTKDPESVIKLYTRITYDDKYEDTVE